MYYSFKITWILEIVFLYKSDVTHWVVVVEIVSIKHNVFFAVQLQARKARWLLHLRYISIKLNGYSDVKAYKLD